MGKSMLDVVVVDVVVVQVGDIVTMRYDNDDDDDDDGASNGPVSFGF